LGIMDRRPDILDVCDPLTARWYGLTPDER